VEDETITIKWLPIAQMPANDLIKALPTQKYATFLWQLNLVDISKKLGENNSGSDPEGPKSDHGLRITDEEEEEEDGGRFAYFSVF
jgi:hypothetical protein